MLIFTLSRKKGMKGKPKLTIIISYYKALENLKLILKALGEQSFKNFEVIVSEDDNNPETVGFITTNKDHYPFPIQHLNQKEDLGFRKNMMLNLSIKASNSDFLVFIDGDCVPHKHFAKQYADKAEIGYILWGRRVMLGQKKSMQILKNKSLSGLDLFSLANSDSEKLKDAIYSPNLSLSLKEKGLKGCNWGIYKEHLVAVNGFDEDYIRAGVGEDDDIEWRLKENGLHKKSMKNKAIVYHLHHERSYADEGVRKNNELLEQKKKANHIKCLHGLDSLD